MNLSASPDPLIPSAEMRSNNRIPNRMGRKSLAIRSMPFHQQGDMSKLLTSLRMLDELKEAVAPWKYDFEAPDSS